MLYLHHNPNDYKTLFYIAFLPGLLAIIASLLLRDKPTTAGNRKSPVSLFSFLHYWKESPAAYKKLVVGLLAFALFNSSDVFLLLKAKEAGLDDTHVIGVYVFYNLVYALSAFPLGALADKIGLKTIFLSGLLIFATVYFGMTFNTNLYWFVGLFFLYGVYAAVTEGISKAWISNITDKKDTATAIGTFSGLQSICAMMASSMAGFLWFQFGSTTTFVATAVVALITAAYIFTSIPQPSSH